MNFLKNSSGLSPSLQGDRQGTVSRIGLWVVKAKVLPFKSSKLCMALSLWTIINDLYITLRLPEGNKQFSPNSFYLPHKGLNRWRLHRPPFLKHLVHLIICLPEDILRAYEVYLTCNHDFLVISTVWRGVIIETTPIFTGLSLSEQREQEWEERWM